MADNGAETDERLLSRMAGGDEDALATFYRRHESALFRFILSRVNDSFEAADIVIEVMHEAWRSAARYQGRSAVRSWLFGIARHKALDRVRSQARHKADALEETDEVPDTSTIDALAAADDAEAVRHCVEGLSAQHREVVHLAFYQDLSYREIAGIAACPEGTVKTRIFHAKRALKACLGQAMESLS